MYNWISLLYSRNDHNIVNQLHFNKKRNKKSVGCRVEHADLGWFLFHRIVQSEVGCSAGVVKIKKLWAFLTEKCSFSFFKNVFPSLSLETYFQAGQADTMALLILRHIHLSWQWSWRYELHSFFSVFHRDQRVTNVFMSVLYRVTTFRFPEWWQ